MKDHIFTAEQMKAFAAFERVRATGRYSMMDQRALTSTNLKKNDFLFIMKNYPKMRKQYLDELKERNKSQLSLFPELT